MSNLHNGNGQQPLVATLREAPPLALGRKDAAKSIGVSERTLWQLTADGHIPIVKIGSRTVYRIAALEKFLAEHEAKRAAAWHKRDRHPGPCRPGRAVQASCRP